MGCLARTVRGISAERKEGGIRSDRKPLSGKGLPLCRFFFAIFWRRGRLERMEQARGNLGDFIYGGEERGFIGLRRFIEAAYLANKLQRGISYFGFGNRRIEVEEVLDVSAHGIGSVARNQDIGSSGLAMSEVGPNLELCLRELLSELERL